MPDTGWTKPGAGANVSGGNEAWVNPGNITADDASTSSTGFLSASETSDYLYGDSFGFSIPIGATIDGVEFRFERQNPFGGSGDEVGDHTVQLVNDSATRFGNNKAAGGDWPSSLTLSSIYGGPTDPWGATLSPAICNDADFGVQVRAEVTSGSFVVGDVDYFELKVYYTETTTLEQEGFRWRNDDGSESTANWAENPDTNHTVAKETRRRLRVLINATGDPAAAQFQLEYKEAGDPDAEYRPVPLT